MDQVNQIERREPADEKDVFDRLREILISKKMKKKTKVALILFVIAAVLVIIFATLSPAIFYHQSFSN